MRASKRPPACSNRPCVVMRPEVKVASPVALAPGGDVEISPPRRGATLVRSVGVILKLRIAPIGTHVKAPSGEVGRLPRGSG